MQCPLCGGPLHLEEPKQFACERGHQLQGSELARMAGDRVTMAFWLAIEALDTEADALRVLATSGGGDERLADQATEDARVLRELVGAHLQPSGGHGDGD